MFYVSAALVAIAFLARGWSTVTAPDWLPLAICGFVGLAIGDAELFAAFARIGPRRTGILFALNAPSPPSGAPSSTTSDSVRRES